MRKKTASTEAAPIVVEEKKAEIEAKTSKRPSRSRKKAVAPAAEEVKKDEVVATEVKEAPVRETKNETIVIAEPKVETKIETKAEPVKKPIPPMPRNLVVRDITDLASSRIPLLNDQQIQQLTLQEAVDRHLIFEAILTQVLDYDIVLSDTNIWLELLVGHTSSHSDPRVNARLTFERQLEFISKLMKKKGGRSMIMSETYEEIDRFACQQEPTNYQQADFTDEILCRNVAARLAKRLILSQQRENRLRIEGICSESHHAAFADPAIIRRTVDLFANGKKVLLLTNDASVAIRSLGMCDDLQRINNIDDKTWDRVYAPIRPMACTMDDLKLLDGYTRQYHFLMQAAGAEWMQDLKPQEPRPAVEVLKINEELFRPGDKHERRSDKQAQERAEAQRKEQQRMAEERKQAQADIQRAQQEMQKLKAEQQKLEQQRQQAQAEQRKLEQRQQAEAQRKQEQQRTEERKKADQRKKEEASQQASEPNVEVAKNEHVTEAAVSPVSTLKPAESSVAENAESANSAVELPAFSAEDMELIATPKKRTHRGGRRRQNKQNAV